MCPNHAIARPLEPGAPLRRDAGITAFEGVVLAFIVVVLVALLLPFPPTNRCRSKHNASQATAQDFAIALKAYEADFGDFPPDEPGNYITRGTKGSLVDLMSLPGPKNFPYYAFREEQFNEKGRWMTLLGTPFKYRKNSGRPPTAPNPATMMNVHTFDLWASGCGDAPACDPETSEPAVNATIKNW